MNTNKSVFFWKWSTGISYKKSCRTQKAEYEQEKTIEDCLENNLFLHSIPHKDMYSEELNVSSKREDQNTKLSQRDMIAQTTINPFIQTNSYADDLKREHDFLRPKDSNISYPE